MAACMIASNDTLPKTVGIVLVGIMLVGIAPVGIGTYTHRLQLNFLSQLVY